MEWLLPSVVATFVATCILFITYTFVYVTDRTPYMLAWTISWGIYAFRYIFLAIHLGYIQSPWLLILNQSCALWSAVLLLIGAQLFALRPLRLPLVLTGAVCLNAWVVYAILAELSFSAMSFPAFLVIGAVYVKIGMTFLRRVDSPGIEHKVVGWIFIVWGIHKADYPFLRPVEWFAPWGYLLATACTILAAVFIILLYLKKSQNALLQHVRFTDSLLETMQDTLYVFDPRTKKSIRWNKALTKAAGYCDHEIESMTAPDDLHPAGAMAKAEAAIAKLADEGKATVKMDLLTASGETIPFEYSAATIETGSGQGLILSLGRDVSHQVRESRLLEARLELREFSDTHSIEEVVELALSQAESLTGSTIAFFHFVSPDQKTLTLGSWSAGTKKACQAGGAGMHYSIDTAGVWCDCVREGRPVVHNDYPSLKDNKGMPEGHVSLVRELVVPIYYKGRIYAILGVGNKQRDYTQSDVNLVMQLATTTVDVVVRKRIEEDLQKNMELAQAATQAKSEFLANMSHEIRTPLNGILGMLQLMKTTELSEEQDEYAGYAVQSCHRLSSLLSDVLDLSKIEAGALSIKSEPFSVTELIEETKQLFFPTARQSDLEIVTSVAPDVPEYLLGDTVRVQQVLTNIVGNALKFTDSGQVTIDVSLLEPVTDQSCKLLFSVTDTGVGIPGDKLETLFEAFTQVDSSYTRQFQGAGLGLSICKHLVTLMGGDIDVESEQGKGSTFNFSIAFKPSPLVPEKKGEPQQPTASGSFSVLLADDDRVTQIATARLLEKDGYTVHVVSDGAAAIESLRSDKYDLVLMDVQMPAMNGMEATERIRKGEAGPGNAAIPVIAMTAYAMMGDREQFLESGADDYIAKPVDGNELKTVINRVMQE